MMNTYSGRRAVAQMQPMEAYLLGIDNGWEYWDLKDHEYHEWYVDSHKKEVSWHLQEGSISGAAYFQGILDAKMEEDDLGVIERLQKQGYNIFA